ncbi:MAG: ATP-binding cassette domain-containing protein, partial [Prevotella sp.]|nr:ATP-binding cassette domain-containing protein [Prevotella sp.]
YHGMGQQERNLRIKELSDYFGLEEYLDKPVYSLSGGWKKRAAIVCAMLHQPKVLFLDEATSALDNICQHIVVENLAQLKCTRIVIAHRLSTIQKCNRIIVLKDGRVEADGNFQELQARGYFPSEKE